MSRDLTSDHVSTMIRADRGDHVRGRSMSSVSGTSPMDDGHDGAMYSNSSEGTYHTPSLASIYQVSCHSKVYNACHKNLHGHVG